MNKNKQTNNQDPQKMYSQCPGVCNWFYFFYHELKESLALCFGILSLLAGTLGRRLGQQNGQTRGAQNSGQLLSVLPPDSYCPGNKIGHNKHWVVISSSIPGWIPSPLEHPHLLSNYSWKNGIDKTILYFISHVLSAFPKWCQINVLEVA